MAATVEGIFRIIDRASEPMRRMERQARQTDRAIAQLGLTTDMVGSPKQQRQINDTDRVLRNFGRGVDDTGGRVKRMNKDLEQSDSRLTRLKRSLLETGGAIRGLGAILGLLKLPAMAAGIGLLVQAVGALGGGIIALIPRVTQLAGLLAPLPIMFTGIGTAMVTVRLATHGLSQALAGNAAALKRLTPEAKAFVTTLRSYHSVMQGLRQSAQQGLFPGLTTALVRLQRGVPIVNRMLNEMGRTLGNLAAQAATRFTTGGFLSDVLGIGRAGNRAVGRGGTAILNILDAVRQLAVAAIPFTDLMGKMIVRASQFIDRWAIFERDSGRFGSFLDKTTKSLTLFGHIVRNVWDWMKALGRAATPLGDMLWRDAERATRSWAKYANSVAGQVKLTQQFLGMHDSIQAIVTLFDDLVRAIFQMGNSAALPKVVNLLDQMIPNLQKLLTLFATTFGPVLADLINQITRTLTFLTGATGPINVFLTLLDKVLKGFNDLMTKVPGLGRIVADAFSIVAIGLFIGRLRGVAAGWFQVAAGARAAAAAQASAAGISPGGVVMPGGSAAGGALGAETALGGALVGGALARKFGIRMVAGEATTASGIVLPGGVVTGAETAAGTGLLARTLARGGTAVRSAGAAASRFATRFVLPAEVALGIYGAATTSTDPHAPGIVQAGQRITGAASAASLGLIRPTMTPGQESRSAGARMFTEAGRYNVGGGRHLVGRIAGSGAGGIPTPYLTIQSDPGRNYESFTHQARRRLDPYGGDSPSTMNQLTHQVAIYRSLISQARAVKNLDQDGVLVQHEYVRQLQQQLQARRAVLASIVQTRNEEERARAYRIVRQEGQAVDIYAKKYGLAGATSRTSADVLRQMGGMHEPGARVLGQQYLGWLRGESLDKSLPAGTRSKLAGQYREMVDAVTAQFKRLGINIAVVNGQIIEGTRRQWGVLAGVMGSAAERAREATTREFTQIQQRAVAALVLMGIRPGNASALVQGIESGRLTTGSVGDVASGKLSPGGALSPHSTGGTPSATSLFGGRDTRVGLFSPDETIVNRHTARAVNAYLRPYGRTLETMTQRETRPNHYPLRGFATGGSASLAGVHPGIRSVAETVLGKFPLSVTSTTTGRHAKDSYHYKGMAVDLGGSPDVMNQAGTWIDNNLRPDLLEGIHNPTLSVKNGADVGPGFWGSKTWGQHVNHIHLAAGGSGAHGTTTGRHGRVRFQTPTSHLSGIPGVLADEAGSLVSAGLRKRLNASLAGAGSGGAPSGGGTATQNMQLGHQMLLQRWGESEWPALVKLWNGESGWRTTATNPSSGAYGIPQSLPGSKMAAAGGDWKTNPGTQMKWGMDYISGRYGSPSAALAAWQHRNPHWYGGGTDSRTFRRPTVIGVGDTPGGEEVTVRRLGASGRRSAARHAGGGPITVMIDKVIQNEPGDTAAILHREMLLLAAELERTGVVGDEDVTA